MLTKKEIEALQTFYRDGTVCAADRKRFAEEIQYIEEVLRAIGGFEPALCRLRRERIWFQWSEVVNPIGE